MKDLISIIIPIFNAEKYLTNTLNSVINQTYKNFEVLLINDGSTDTSQIICEEIAKKDNRFIVINKENGGVSCARNLGLELAKGKYIAFLDADDLLDNDYLQVLYDDIINNDVDISFCDCNIIDESELSSDKVIVKNEVKLENRIKTSRIINNKWNFIDDYLSGKEWYMCTVWGMLVKSSFAKKVRFENYKYDEDLLFTLNLLLLGPKAYLNIWQGYNYIRWNESTTIKNGINNINRTLCLINVRKFVYIQTKKCKSKELQKKAKKAYLNTTLGLLLAFINSNDKELYNKEKNNLKRHAVSVLKMGYVNFFKQFLLLCFLINSNLFWNIMRLKNFFK